MPRSKPALDLGAELLTSVKEMKAGTGARTHAPQLTAMARARIASGLSQAAFATLLGVSVRTLQDWEQGRREPSGAAKTLIKVAERHPEVLQELAS
ncbi:MAG: helix-turn-helix domain-containing protein [Rhodocyclaceae bacterium]|nr:helix-turn-helix domain-containing protein [Rhodocyclaceae bacterium]MBX3670478.1 helix-turn-helix domain-containing protein [Rhodocyclaceae bacterium]